jgi:hypothetical protein
MTEHSDAARSDRRIADFYAPLFALSRDAHAIGEFEVAYHALVAAMHAVAEGDDVALLDAVEREARRQIAWIDEHAPEHRLSTSSAQKHAHPGVYAMLAREAAMQADLAHLRKNHQVG